MVITKGKQLEDDPIVVQLLTGASVDVQSFSKVKVAMVCDNQQVKSSTTKVSPPLPLYSPSFLPPFLASFLPSFLAVLLSSHYFVSFLLDFFLIFLLLSFSSLSLSLSFPFPFPGLLIRCPGDRERYADDGQFQAAGQILSQICGGDAQESRQTQIWDSAANPTRSPIPDSDSRKQLIPILHCNY